MNYVTVRRFPRRADMTRRLISLTVCAVAVSAVPAQASCIQSTARQKLERADAVFVGRVLSVSAKGGSASFRVTSVRKGRLRKGQSVRVHADHYPSSVTFNWSPRVGDRYRLYVRRAGRRWLTNDCMGTREL